MRVIWAVSFDAFERRYIEQFLFKDVEFLDLDECPLPTLADDLIVVTGGGIDLEPRMASIWSQVSHSSFYVISDETVSHRATPYQHSRVTFRNLPYPGWAGPKGWALPLGFNGGMVDFKSPSARKELVWSFAGDTNKPGRHAMLSALESIGPNFVHPTKMWADPSGLSPAELFDLYSRSHFVPCANGNVSPDTNRVMEALQAGSIPIVPRFYGIDYYRLLFGPHPFIVVRSWKEAAGVVKLLVADSDALLDRHKRVSDWYDQFLQDLRHDIEALVAGQKLDSLRSPQFRYQRRASRNLFIRAIFWFHFRRPIYRARRAVRRAWNYILVRTRITRIISFRQS